MVGGAQERRGGFVVKNPENNLRDIKISMQLGEDGAPMQLASRHVILLRLENSGPPQAKMNKGGLLPMELREVYSEFPDGELILLTDAVSGSRVWVECQGGRAASLRRFHLPQAGLLRDSEGLNLQVPPGWWIVRPQVCFLSVNALTLSCDPHRYVW